MTAPAERGPHVVRLMGGLGNQMYQYALGRSVADRCGLDLWLDDRWYAGRTDRRYALDAFRIRAARLPSAEHSRADAYPRFVEQDEAFDARALEVSAPTYFEGYFQSWRYADRAMLRRDFAWADPPSEGLSSALAAAGASGTVAVHVRRGDYVSNASTAAFHGTCDLDYYARAMAALDRDTEVSSVFVFSDDPQWARANLRFAFPTHSVDALGVTLDVEQLRLMTACQHHIIANSSFSWWGAYLGARDAQRVVAPARWFTHTERCPEDRVPPSWRRV